MEKEIETRFNKDKWVHETKHDLWLTDYDAYVLAEELKFRVIRIKSMRDKCGISPNDKEAEPNRHIETILKVCKQLGLDVKTD